MNPIDANRDKKTKIQTPTPGGNDHVKPTMEGLRPTEEMETTDVTRRGKNIITEATINSIFNTIEVSLQEPTIF